MCPHPCFDRHASAGTTSANTAQWWGVGVDVLGRDRGPFCEVNVDAVVQVDAAQRASNLAPPQLWGVEVKVRPIWGVPGKLVPQAVARTVRGQAVARVDLGETREDGSTPPAFAVGQCAVEVPYHDLVGHHLP